MALFIHSLLQGNTKLLVLLLVVGFWWGKGGSSPKYFRTQLLL